MSNESSIGGIKKGEISLSSNTSEDQNMPIPGMLTVIHETSEEQKSRLDHSYSKQEA